MRNLGSIAVIGATLFVCIVALVLLHAPPARGHMAESGFVYPGYCCGETDCGHALSAVRNQDGSLTVTTKHGTATFPANFKYEDSPDGLIHACFTSVKLYCLFLAVGG